MEADVNLPFHTIIINPKSYNVNCLKALGKKSVPLFAVIRSSDNPVRWSA